MSLTRKIQTTVEGGHLGSAVPTESSVRSSQRTDLDQTRVVLNQLDRAIQRVQESNNVTHGALDAIHDVLVTVQSDLNQLETAIKTASTGPNGLTGALMRADKSDKPTQVAQSEPVSIGIRLAADQEGPEKHPRIKGSVDFSANVWKLLAIVSAVIALVQQVLK